MTVVISFMDRSFHSTLVLAKSILAILLLGSLSLYGQAQYGSSPQHGAYFNVNGIELYYEVYGEGDPLLLLHGNGGSIKSHSQRIEHYKTDYQVIVVDHRYHGNSGNGEAELTYTLSADDIGKLLIHLEVDSALVWGQSDGGIIALLLAINYPEQVAKIASFGPNIRPDGLLDELTQILVETIPTLPEGRQKAHYTLLRDHPNLSTEDLKKIKTPTLLMFGDRDAFKISHVMEMFEAMSNVNLFIMPGATHFGAYEKQDLFYQVLDDFFEKPFTNKTTLEAFQGN